MMEIKPLHHLPNNFNEGWGDSGYETAKVYEVSVINGQQNYSFQLQETERFYKKSYLVDAVAITGFNEMIKKGQSFGAFEKEQLIGVLIAETRAWNNSFYIENILVAEPHRRRGIGREMIMAAIRQCEQANCRLLVLETQQTNFPAIQFYLKQGFKITGMDLKLYPEPSNQEVAVWMSYDNLRYRARL